MLKSFFKFPEVLAKQEFPIELYGPPILYGPPFKPAEFVVNLGKYILVLAIPIIGLAFLLKRKFFKYKNDPRNNQNRKA